MSISCGVIAKRGKAAHRWFSIRVANGAVLVREKFATIRCISCRDSVCLARHYYEVQVSLKLHDGGCVGGSEY